jgi:hypothetical protein
VFEHRRRAKRLAAAMRLRASTPDGDVACATGIARPLARMLTAPGSGLRVLVYGLDVRDGAGDYPLSPSGERFSTIELCAFALDVDGVGTVVVDSAFGELHDIPVRTIATPATTWRDFKETRGIAFAFAPHEAIVVPGARLSIVGVVERVAAPPDSEAGFRELRTTLRLVGDFDRPILVASAR